MSLSNEIITHQLDPVLFDQRRCEFRLDPKVYLSNWRLADLGIKVSGGNQDHSTKHKNTRFATNLGAYAIIDRIRLLNGSVEIAELRNVNQFLAFNNLQRTNANVSGRTIVETTETVPTRFWHAPQPGLVRNTSTGLPSLAALRMT